MISCLQLGTCLAYAHICPACKTRPLRRACCGCSRSNKPFMGSSMGVSIKTKNGNGSTQFSLSSEVTILGSKADNLFRVIATRPNSLRFLLYLLSTHLSSQPCSDKATVSPYSRGTASSTTRWTIRSRFTSVCIPGLESSRMLISLLQTTPPFDANSPNILDAAATRKRGTRLHSSHGFVSYPLSPSWPSPSPSPSSS